MAQDEVTQRLIYDFQRRHADLARSRPAADVELSARRLAQQIQNSGTQISEGEFVDAIAADLRANGMHSAGGPFGQSSDLGNKTGESFIEELKRVQRESGFF